MFQGHRGVEEEPPPGTILNRSLKQRSVTCRVIHARSSDKAMFDVQWSHRTDS